MSDINIALIGYGEIGRLHLERWREVTGARIAIVCDIDPLQAQAAGALAGCDVVTQWLDALEQPSLDIVDICTPNDLHLPIALSALDHDLHVLCETPLARTAEEARLMVERAELRDRILMNAFCYRVDPAILFIREMLDNDDIGRPLMFRCRFSVHFDGVEKLWWSKKDTAGGGALHAIAVHAIDLFRYLVGEVATARGVLSHFNPEIELEDSVIALLTANNGATGVIESSWSTPGGRNILELYGSAGACEMNFDTGLLSYKTADMPVWQFKDFTDPDRLQQQIEHFTDVVRREKPPITTGADGLRALEIIEEIRRHTGDIQ